MYNMDKDTYNYFIDGVQNCQSRLDEWIEQGFEDDTEKQLCTQAYWDLFSAAKTLEAAKKINESAHHDRVEAALHRVETGQATLHDATVIRMALS